jgi:hypothetical protein
MLFQKKIEYQQDQILVYFVDQYGRIQGTLKAYSVDKYEEIREDLLVYTQEYKNGSPVGERVNLYYSV